MRTETEMFDVILQTAKVLQVDAVAMSGSRTDTKASKDEFQDYDVVYVVDDIDNLTSDLSWLDQFSTRFNRNPLRACYIIHRESPPRHVFA